MRFIWHEALWLLLSVPMLIGAYELIVRRAQAREAIRYSNLGIANEAAGASQWLRRRVPPLVFLLGIVGLLLAAARPAAVFLVPAHRGTVVLAMDVSISMAATDVEPTRLAAAQAAAAEFVKKVPAGIRVGIVAFGGYAEVVRLPTVDKEEVLRALPRLRLQQYTAIGSALLAALLTIDPTAAVDPKYDLFSRIENLPEPPPGYIPDIPAASHEPTPKAPGAINPSSLVILVSDGKGTLGVSEYKAAEILAGHGIRVYTIGVGTPYGGIAQVEGSSPIHAEFEEETLKLIADITRAEYFHASSPEKLKSVYEALSDGTIREPKEIEVSAVLVALAGVLLVVGAALSLKWHSHPA
ncbi:MAG: VWA domain-containing protein [Betaproteobacteria bacterium]|nr:MAG: VWA domain-containing protein [Betaproteobacteria bacterium]